MFITDPDEAKKAFIKYIETLNLSEEELIKIANDFEVANNELRSISFDDKNDNLIVSGA